MQEEEEAELSAPIPVSARAAAAGGGGGAAASAYNAELPSSLNQLLTQTGGLVLPPAMDGVMEV